VLQYASPILDAQTWEGLPQQFGLSFYRDDRKLITDSNWAPLRQALFTFTLSSALLMDFLASLRNLMALHWLIFCWSLRILARARPNLPGRSMVMPGAFDSHSSDTVLVGLK